MALNVSSLGSRSRAALSQGSTHIPHRRIQHVVGCSPISQRCKRWWGAGIEPSARRTVQWNAPHSEKLEVAVILQGEEVTVAR